MIEPPERITSRSARAAFVPTLEKYSTPTARCFSRMIRATCAFVTTDEIFASQGGLEVCVGGTVAAAVFLRDLVEAGAILEVAIEIRIGWDAECGGCFEECAGEGIHCSAGLRRGAGHLCRGIPIRLVLASAIF